MTAVLTEDEALGLHAAIACARMRGGCVVMTAERCDELDHVVRSMTACDPPTHPRSDATASLLDVIDRLEQLEERVSRLDQRTAPDPRIGRRCRVMAFGSSAPALTAIVVHVDWDGTLLVRGVDTDPSWPPMRIPPDDVEWLDAPPPPAAPLSDFKLAHCSRSIDQLRADAHAVHDRVSHALQRHLPERR